MEEDVWRIGVEGEPPPEESRRRIDRPVAYGEPGRSELGLMSKGRGGPLRRRPDRQQYDGEDSEYLTPENLGRRQILSFPAKSQKVGIDASILQARGEPWRRNRKNIARIEMSSKFDEAVFRDQREDQ